MGKKTIKVDLNFLSDADHEYISNIFEDALSMAGYNPETCVTKNWVLKFDFEETEE